MLKSIRSQIFIAFFALIVLIAGIGGYGVFKTSQARQVIGDLFDKPLTAIDSAREASLFFSEMNSELLRQRAAGAEPLADRDTLDARSKDVFDDLRVARDRSLTKQPVDTIDGLTAQIQQWNMLRQKSDSNAATLDSSSFAIIAQFDRLAEETKDDAFAAREKAIRDFQNYLQLSIVATVAALLLSVAVTFVLSRRILRPLSAAAAVANRVAGGDFQTPIPKGGGDETGMLLRSMSVMQANIQEMVEREAAQRRSAQNRLVDAIEGSHEGMLLVDGEGRIVIVNSQLTNFFPSISKTMVPGALFAQVFAGAKERPHATETPDAWLKLLVADGEIELANGRWLRVSPSSTREGGRFLFLSDITPIKEREESLKAARRAAEAASVAKSNFVANMGHELRTPLNAIIGFSEIISGEQFGPVGTPQYKEYAGDILASGCHLLAIINDVLDLAKSTDGKLHFEAERVELGAIVADCGRLVAEQCETGGLTLIIPTSKIPLYAWGEEAKLRQILLNLLSNAIKFSPAGGTITISAKGVADDMLELAIADTGIGMRPEDIAVAMEPFGQIDSALARRYEGTGLGLPLTKALAELQGGRMEIESEVGRGTAVRIFLRACQEVEVRLPRRASA